MATVHKNYSPAHKASVRQQSNYRWQYERRLIVKTNYLGIVFVEKKFLETDSVSYIYSKHNEIWSSLWSVAPHSSSSLYPVSKKNVMK